MTVRKSIFNLLSAAILFSSTVVQALPIVEADAFIVGDNKAVRQISTGLVWMDFGTNNDKSFNQVVSELGSTYKGWRLAREGEVRNLYGELFSDADFHVSVSGEMDYWRGINVLDVLAIFGADSSYSYYSFDGVNGFDFFNTFGSGLFVTDTHKLTHASMQHLEYLNGNGLSVDSFALIGSGYFEIADIADEVIGITTYLVKESAVPEPSSVFLIGLGLLGLGVARRRTAK